MRGHGSPSCVVVGVDPGPTPGVVLIGGLGSNGAVFQCDAVSVRWLVGALLSLPGSGSTRVLLTVEKFVVGPRASRSSHAKAGALTRDMIGDLCAMGAGMAGVTVVRRPAADVMPWATDKRLSAAGLLDPTKGMPHARAAARHALYTAVCDAGLPDPLSTKGA